MLSPANRFFDRARKEVDLASFVRQQVGGVDPKKIGASYRWATCPIPSCGSGSKDSRRFSVKGDCARCFVCGFQGGVVDLAAEIWGCDALEAAKRLLMADRPPVKVVSLATESDVPEEEQHEALHQVLTILRKHICVPRPAGLTYLAGMRGLPHEVIEEALKRGIVGMLPCNPVEATKFLVDRVGKELLEKSGLWKPGKRMPGIAYKPLVFFMPDLRSAEFRMLKEPKPDESKSIRYGPLLYPWFWKGKTPGIMVVEGVIDMLSAVALGYRGSVVAVPGCNNWRAEWFEKLAMKGMANVVHICLDNDTENPKNPGQTWAKKMAEALQVLGIRHRIDAPKEGDVNDALRAKRLPIGEPLQVPIAA